MDPCVYVYVYVCVCVCVQIRFIDHFAQGRHHRASRGLEQSQSEFGDRAHPLSAHPLAHSPLVVCANWCCLWLHRPPDLVVPPTRPPPSHCDSRSIRKYIPSCSRLTGTYTRSPPHTYTLTLTLTHSHTHTSFTDAVPSASHVSGGGHANERRVPAEDAA